MSKSDGTSAHGVATQSLYVASQSFSYQSPDIEMDITEMVEKWLDDTIDNNGLLCLS